MTLEDLKLQIASQMDETDLLDFLDIGMSDLVEILEEQIEDRQDDFRASLQG